MSNCGSKVGIGSCSTSTNCPDSMGCPSDRCPDFTIKRHDVKPPMRIAVSDCDGPLDLSETGLVLEANMWATGRLKTAITETDTEISLADNIGFEQAMVGDVVVLDRARSPERMEIIGFDENNGTISVRRGIDGTTTASAWKRGTSLRIFRVVNGVASIEMVTEDLTQEDGSVLRDQLTGTFLVYNFLPSDTCLAGCYWLEFKLIKMADTSASPSVISATPSLVGCQLGDGVEWVRRFPSDSEAFLIKIFNSPTAEI